MIENNTFVGNPQIIAALFECGRKTTEMKIDNNVTKYVYIKGRKHVVFRVTKRIPDTKNKIEILR